MMFALTVEFVSAITLGRCVNLSKLDTNLDLQLLFEIGMCKAGYTPTQRASKEINSELQNFFFNPLTKMK